MILLVLVSLFILDGFGVLLNAETPSASPETAVQVVKILYEIDYEKIDNPEFWVG